jgi:hypothetical protein
MRHALGVTLLFVLGSAQAAPVIYTYTSAPLDQFTTNQPDGWPDELNSLVGAEISFSFQVDAPLPANLFSEFFSSQYNENTLFRYSDPITTVDWQPQATSDYLFDVALRTDEFGDIDRLKVYVNWRGSLAQDDGFISATFLYDWPEGSNYIESSARYRLPIVNHLNPDNVAASINEMGVWTTNVVPIPAAVWLFGSSLGLLGWFRRR